MERFCSNCGSKMVDDAVLCTNCGSKQENPVGFENEANTAPETDIYNNEITNVLSSDNTADPTTPKKKRTGLIVAIVAVILILLALIGSTAEKAFQDQGYGSTETDVVEVPDDNVIPEAAAEDENKEYSKGVSTSTTYESEFIGVRYNAPEGWVLATEDELVQQLGEDPETTWEMQAISGIDGSNIIVALEELPSKNFSESMYISSLKKVLQSHTQVSVSNLREEGTVVIAGKEYLTLAYDATQNGVSYTQTMHVRKINKYMVSITVTSVSSSNEEILSAFTAY